MRADPALGLLQRKMFELIRAPESVQQGLARLGIDATALAAWVAGDERLDAMGRVGIYADMYFFRLLDVLRGAFPKVRDAVGDETFGALASEYLDRHPSRHPSLRHLGDRFAAFLATDADLPTWLADLAHLEWARYDVFDAADADTLTGAELATMTPEAFGALPLVLVPAHRVVEVGHAVERVWRALGRDETTKEPPAEPRSILVWRHENTVYHRVLDPLERAVWPTIAAGATFGLVCDELARRLPEQDAAARAAFSLLGRLVADGMLCTTRRVTP